MRDNPQRHRFEIEVDGQVSGFAEYRIDGDRVVVPHSEIDPDFRGQGLGSILAGRTLDALRERGVTVVPSCPFFADYVAEHPEYADLVAD